MHIYRGIQSRYEWNVLMFLISHLRKTIKSQSRPQEASIQMIILLWKQFTRSELGEKCNPTLRISALRSGSLVRNTYFARLSLVAAYCVPISRTCSPGSVRLAVQCYVGGPGVWRKVMSWRMLQRFKVACLQQSNKVNATK